MSILRDGPTAYFFFRTYVSPKNNFFVLGVDIFVRKTLLKEVSQFFISFFVSVYLSEKTLAQPFP